MSGPTSDSIALYSEGSFEDHVQELVDYLARGRSEDDRIAFIKPFSNALLPDDSKKPFEEDSDRRKGVLQLVLAEVKGLGEGTDREVEGFFNLLISHLLANWTTSAAVSPHLSVLTSTIKSSPRPTSLRYRILSNIFNLLPRTSPLRLKVYGVLLDLARENEEVDVLNLGQVDFQKWLNEWEISDEEKIIFLKRLSDVSKSTGSSLRAYEYLLLRAKILPSSSQHASSTVHDALIAGLALPTIHNFDELLKLPNLNSVKESPLFGLLKIFLTKDLSEFGTWVSQNESVLSKYGLDKSALEKKMRVLTLASLTSNHVGKEVSYATIAKTLQIPESEVERWVIQGVRAKLLVGKLNQPAKTLSVIRSTTRSFEKEDWEVVGKRLAVWKATLQDVLTVVVNARGKAAQAGVGSAEKSQQSLSVST